MDEDLLLELTADIVAAHVGNNNVPINDVANLVHQVHGALAKLGASAEESAPEAKTPAVSVRSSSKPDHLVCPSYPMVAPDYSDKRSKMAQSIGLGRRKEADTDA